MEPRVYRFAGGWAVSGNGFATFAATEEEARRHYRQMAPTSACCEANGCGNDAAAELDGMALCAEHYANVTSRAGADDSTDRSPTREPVRPPSLDRRAAW